MRRIGLIVAFVCAVGLLATETNAQGRFWVLVNGALRYTGQIVVSGTSVVLGNGIGTTSTDGQVLRNSTAAAAGAQQYSPRTCWEGQGWKTDATAASQSVVFCAETQPVQGTSAPSGNWILKASINGGAFSTVGTFSSDGSLAIGTNPATAGPFRMANAAFLTARNAANDTNYRLIGVNSSNQIRIDEDGRGIITGSFLTATQLTTNAGTASSGYGAGSGATVTQTASKTTGVTIDRATGQVTLHNAALNTLTTACFTVTNAAATAAMTVSYAHVSGGTAGAYLAFTGATAAGSFSMCVMNVTGGSLSEAPVFQFNLHRGATS